jgi:hypothetical protein
VHTEGIRLDLAGQPRQRWEIVGMLASAQPTLEAQEVGMRRAQRFATPHASKLGLRVAIFGVALPFPRRDAHGDLSITEHVTGEPCYAGRPPQNAADGADAIDSHAGGDAQLVDAPH